MSDASVSRTWTGPLLGRLRALAAPATVFSLGLVLAGCQTDGSAGPGGPATLAFDSIDGPPKATFEKLVSELSTEAQTQRVPVVSRDEPSAYRVRGYLAVHSDKAKTSVSYAWDVFDANRQRVARITGEESMKRVKGDAWAACDEELLNRIAGQSMASLAEAVGIRPSAQPEAQPVTETAAAPQGPAAAPEEAPAAPEAVPEAAPPPVIDGDGPPVATAPAASAAPLAFAAQ